MFDQVSSFLLVMMACSSHDVKHLTLLIQPPNSIPFPLIHSLLLPLATAFSLSFLLLLCSTAFTFSGYSSALAGAPPHYQVLQIGPSGVRVLPLGCRQKLRWPLLKAFWSERSACAFLGCRQKRRWP